METKLIKAVWSVKFFIKSFLTQDKISESEFGSVFFEMHPLQDFDIFTNESVFPSYLPVW